MHSTYTCSALTHAENAHMHSTTSYIGSDKIAKIKHHESLNAYFLSTKWNVEKTTHTLMWKNNLCWPSVLYF